MQKETGAENLMIFGGLFVLVYIVSFSSWSIPYHILFISIFLLFSFLIYKDIYNSTTHFRCKNGYRVLKEDAVIVNVQEDKVGTIHYPRIRTTVYFDDGFQFVSHHCTVIRPGRFGTATLSDEEREDILQDASKTHTDILALYKQK